MDISIHQPLIRGVSSTDGLSANSVSVGLVQGAFALLIMNAVLYGLAWAKLGDLPSHYQLFMLLSSLLCYISTSFFRVYDYQLSMLGAQLRLVASWAAMLSILGFAGFVTKTSTLFSREVLLLWMTGAFVAQAFGLLCLQSLFQQYHAHLVKARKTAIIGGGDFAQRVAERLRSERVVNLVGVIDHRADAEGKTQDNTKENTEANTKDNIKDDTEASPKAFAGGNYLGDIRELRKLIDDHQISRLYIVLPAQEMALVDALYVDLLDTPADVVWLPDCGQHLLLNHSVGAVQGLPAIYLNESPLSRNPSAALFKSLIDRVGALSLLITLLPLLVFVAAMIKLTSKGPVLFVQNRHGLNGRVFGLIKFRSMAEHTDKGVTQATQHDPRVTWIGRLIRKTSIDELPQLINVMQGHMSLVGPRPHAVEHNTYYSQKLQAYMSRHKVKPGMTGWAQVNGSRGQTETLEKMQKRLELDLEYINTWSIALDMAILLKTPIALLKTEAY